MKVDRIVAEINTTLTLTQAELDALMAGIGKMSHDDWIRNGCTEQHAETIVNWWHEINYMHNSDYSAGGSKYYSITK